MTPVVPLVRLRRVSGVVNTSLGVWLKSVQPVSIANVGFSFADSTGALYLLTPPGFTGWASRIAVVRGKYGGDMAYFTPTTDLSAYDTLLDQTVLDQVSGLVSFGSDQPVASTEYDIGISILLAAPVLYGSGVPAPQVTLSLFGSSGANNAMGGGATAAGSAGASTGNNPRSGGGGRTI